MLCSQSVLHLHPHLLHRKSIQNVTDESMHQHGLRLCFANSTRSRIKQSLLVELTNGTAVAALYVICINFQFRLCVDRSLVRDEDVSVLLISIRLLGVRSYKHLAIEHARA